MVQFVHWPKKISVVALSRINLSATRLPPKQMCSSDFCNSSGAAILRYHPMCDMSFILMFQKEAINHIVSFSGPAKSKSQLLLPTFRNILYHCDSVMWHKYLLKTITSWSFRNTDASKSLNPVPSMLLVLDSWAWVDLAGNPPDSWTGATFNGKREKWFCIANSCQNKQTFVKRHGTMQSNTFKKKQNKTVQDAPTVIFIN